MSVLRNNLTGIAALLMGKVPPLPPLSDAERAASRSPAIPTLPKNSCGSQNIVVGTRVVSGLIQDAVNSSVSGLIVQMLLSDGP